MDNPHIKYFPDLVQGTDEWFAARCGLLTASEIPRILTKKTLKPSNDEKMRIHFFELLAQRINQYVEISYQSDDMLRGHDEEILARQAYAKAYAPVQIMGFVTNSRHGFTLGYSPDGLVGEDGQIECKSRRQRFQVQTIVEHIAIGGGRTIPEDFVIQVQAGLIVSERKWCDYTSYCGGMPMATIRVYPDPVVQDAILYAAHDFEAKMSVARQDFEAALASNARLIPTERRIEQEMYIGGSR